MPKRIHTQRDFEIIFAERESSVEGTSSNLEAFSEYEDHVSVNTESDSELEEEDEIAPQPAPGPVHQQPAHQQPAGGERWMPKNCEIEWSSSLRNEPSRMAVNVIRMQPGPMRMVVTHVQNIKSSFELFIPDTNQNIILDCTHLEGRRVFGERWKEMDQTPLHAYFGVLILAGVFRST